MFDFFKKNDSEVQRDVMNELEWDPKISSNLITVTSSEGYVTLRGSVPHYFEKASAEQAAQRVGGVRAVADELEVNLLSKYERSDADIAKAAVLALDNNYMLPKGIDVSVDRAWVTLRGNTEWNFERDAAKDTVTALMGVRGVTNEISIRTQLESSDIKTRIEDALKRSAESEGRRIHVEVEGNGVTLTGNVHSFGEIEDARLAAWNAPGVLSVKNELMIAA